MRVANFPERRLGEIHASVKVCIAPPRCDDQVPQKRDVYIVGNYAPATAGFYLVDQGA